MINSTSDEPRWRRLPEARPRQIIDAAVEVFGEHGLAAARLEDIARRAGVSKGTIYLYFPNKEALFCEMIRQLVAETIILAQEQATATAASATDQLRHYARSVWQHMRSPMFIKLHRLAMGELHNFPALQEFFNREVPVRNMNVVSGILRHGIATGEFRKMDEVADARMFQAVVLTHAVWCAQRQRNSFVAHLSDDEVLDQILDFYFGAVRKEPAPRPGPSDSTAGAQG